MIVINIYILKDFIPHVIFFCQKPFTECTMHLQHRCDAPIDNRDNAVNHNGDDGAAATTPATYVPADAYSAQEQ